VLRFLSALNTKKCINAWPSASSDYGDYAGKNPFASAVRMWDCTDGTDDSQLFKPTKQGSG
jgi:hypothetical protein